MARRAPHLLEVVVLPGDPQAALDVHGARVAALLRAGEDLLELDHPGVGEQEGLVAGRDQAGAGHHRVAALREELQEAAADLGGRQGVHGRQGIRGRRGLRWLRGRAHWLATGGSGGVSGISGVDIRLMVPNGARGTRPGRCGRLAGRPTPRLVANQWWAGTVRRGRADPAATGAPEHSHPTRVAHPAGRRRGYSAPPGPEPASDPIRFTEPPATTHPASTESGSWFLINPSLPFGRAPVRVPRLVNQVSASVDPGLRFRLCETAVNARRSLVGDHRCEGSHGWCVGDDGHARLVEYNDPLSDDP